MLRAETSVFERYLHLVAVVCAVLPGAGRKSCFFSGSRPAALFLQDWPVWYHWR